MELRSIMDSTGALLKLLDRYYIHKNWYPNGLHRKASFLVLPGPPGKEEGEKGRLSPFHFLFLSVRRNGIYFQALALKSEWNPYAPSLTS